MVALTIWLLSLALWSCGLLGLRIRSIDYLETLWLLLLFCLEFLGFTPRHWVDFLCVQVILIICVVCDWENVDEMRGKILGYNTNYTITFKNHDLYWSIEVQFQSSANQLQKVIVITPFICNLEFTRIQPLLYPIFLWRLNTLEEV